MKPLSHRLKIAVSYTACPRPSQLVPLARSLTPHIVGRSIADQAAVAVGSSKAARRAAANAEVLAMQARLAEVEAECQQLRSNLHDNNAAAANGGAGASGHRGNENGCRSPASQALIPRGAANRRRAPQTELRVRGNIIGHARNNM